MSNELLEVVISDLEKLTADLKAFAGKPVEAVEHEPEAVAAEKRREPVAVGKMPEPVAAGKKQEPEAAEPEKAEDKVIEFSEIRKVLARLSAQGHTAEVRELIQGFGVSRLSDVPQEKYAELMEKAEVLNGK